MKPNREPAKAPSINRRTAIGLGVVSGLALTNVSTEVLGKSPPSAGAVDQHAAAAWQFATKISYKCAAGYFVVLYSDDNFAGEPLLLTKPELLPKPQSGSMPAGWGAKSGSIVVGPGAVLRLIHKVNDLDAHITLLPGESMADTRTVGIADGASSWKVFPAGNLHPPY
jgi:hypothetical protein